jgi:hypothetical protein
MRPRSHTEGRHHTAAVSQPMSGSGGGGGPALGDGGPFERLRLPFDHSRRFPAVARQNHDDLRLAFHADGDGRPVVDFALNPGLKQQTARGFFDSAPRGVQIARRLCLQ